MICRNDSLFTTLYTYHFARVLRPCTVAYFFFFIIIIKGSFRFAKLKEDLFKQFFQQSDKKDASVKHIDAFSIQNS